MRKKVAIFGSTGSIGTSTLQVIRNNPHLFEVVTLVAGSNVDLLIEQAKEFMPKYLYIKDASNASKLFNVLKNSNVSISKENIFYGETGMEEISSIYEFDIAVSALVGIAGLKPTYNLIMSGKDIALANKEVLVTGGSLIIEHAKKYNARLLTVDSEHSAIMQCLQGEEQNPIDKILLTASGGPFFTKDLEFGITVENVLKHPTWKMGPKITVDSATLMNKGFEVIEATLLFDVQPKQVKVVVHRQSIVHSAVQFKDGTIMASLGPTNMQIPIAYALNFPNRIPNNLQRVDLFQLLNLTFEKPNPEKFPCLKYAYYALEQGLDTQIVLNAANEFAVASFLNKKIDFITIPIIIEKILTSYSSSSIKIDSVQTVMELDTDVRKQAACLIER